MMPTTVIPKNKVNNCHFMIFFNIKACGIDNVTVEVINAKIDPKGTPLLTKTSIIGMILIEFA